MGGSGIGADYLMTMRPEELRVPVETVHGYDLPPGVTNKTLVVFISHSGDTEEVLSCYDQARKLRARILVVTGGGMLAARARRHGIPFYRYTFTSPPRMALGYTFIPLVVLLRRLGVLRPAAGKLDESVAELYRLRDRVHLDVPVKRNVAKQLAVRLHGRVPYVFGSGILTQVARRWKCQFNENAKMFSVADELPELNHNTVEGIHFPREMQRAVTVLLLRSSYDHPQNVKRFRILEGVLRRNRINYERIKAPGTDVLAQKLACTYLGDYVSYYLALLNGVDPTPVETIEGAKRKLRP